MGQNNQKDQKGPKMTAAVMLVQNNQNNQKIWSLHISHTILKVRFFWDTLYIRKSTSQSRFSSSVLWADNGFVRLFSTLRLFWSEMITILGLPFHLCQFQYDHICLFTRATFAAQYSLKGAQHKKNLAPIQISQVFSAPPK